MRIGALLKGPVTLLLATLLCCFIPVRAQNFATLTVDLNLVIAIDCSYSVNRNEFDLQVHGTAQALADPEVIDAITSGPLGKISITVVQWAGINNQIIAVPWRTIGGTADAYRVAIEIKQQPRKVAEGATSISAMINTGLLLLARAPTSAQRNIIDISSDGLNNAGSKVDQLRDLAIERGVIINGLTILNEHYFLHHYFRNHVIGGLGSFVEISNTYSDYGEAIKRKLLREIRGNNFS